MKYKLTFTRTENGELHSRGREIDGKHYLICEKGKVSEYIRTNAYVALTQQVRESKKSLNVATLEIITS